MTCTLAIHRSPDLMPVVFPPFKSVPQAILEIENGYVPLKKNDLILLFVDSAVVVYGVKLPSRIAWFEGTLPTVEKVEREFMGYNVLDERYEYAWNTLYLGSLKLTDVLRILGGVHVPKYEFNRIGLYMIEQMNPHASQKTIEKTKGIFRIDALRNLHAYDRKYHDLDTYMRRCNAIDKDYILACFNLCESNLQGISSETINSILSHIRRIFQVKQLSNAEFQQNALKFIRATIPFVELMNMIHANLQTP